MKVVIVTRKFYLSNTYYIVIFLIFFSLVHRKGSTRALPPHHPLIPVDYQLTGQPVLIGGTMGSCSYVLTGTEQGMEQTFG